MERESMFEGGHTNLPDKILDNPTKGKKALLPTTKFVYVVLRWCKDVIEKRHDRFDPSYSYMNTRFGIQPSSYLTALNQLEKLDIISVDKGDSNGVNKRLKIDFIYCKDIKVQLIPSILITTTLLTIQQKLFLIFVWREFYITYNKSDKPKLIDTKLSAYKLAKSLKSVGISKPSVYKYLSELSGEDNNYIKLIKPSGNGYEIDVKVLIAMYDYDSSIWESYKANKKVSAPIYTKPEPGEYKYEDGRIFRSKYF